MIRTFCIENVVLPTRVSRIHYCLESLSLRPLFGPCRVRILLDILCYSFDSDGQSSTNSLQRLFPSRTGERCRLQTNVIVVFGWQSRNRNHVELDGDMKVSHVSKLTSIYCKSIFSSKCFSYRKHSVLHHHTTPVKMSCWSTRDQPSSRRDPTTDAWRPSTPRPYQH
jgi:hypothetical protein